MSMWNQMIFQDAITPIMSQLIMLHDHAMLILTLVMSIVGMVMVKSTMMSKNSCRNFINAQYLETMWTVLPAIILQALALPSLRLLYLMEESKDPDMILKVTGHQWYWTYNYIMQNMNKNNFMMIMFDSYMIPTNELKMGEYRLLEVDNRAVLPINSEIQFMITSSDVIHAFAIPSLGLKVDAVPGRLNQITTYINRPGIYYGQCSEICGANHSFMPIVVEAIPYNSFWKWCLKMIY